jgi:hypothetical protein
MSKENQQKILSVDMSMRRNLKGYAFASMLTLKERLDIMDKM